MLPGRNVLIAPVRRNALYAFIFFLGCLWFGVLAHAQQAAANDPDAGKEPAREKTERDDNPALRAAWFMRGRKSPDKTPPAALLQRAFRQKIQMRIAAEQARQQLLQTQGTQMLAGPGVNPMTISQPAWQSLGPAPLTGMFSRFGNATGRIQAMTIDQADTTGNTVFAAAAYGGVWKSTNAAAADPTTVTWTALFDTDAAASTLATSAVSLQPGNSNVILVGTGEPDNAIDSYYGMGILRSTDGGAHWTMISSADSGTKSFLGMGVAKFAWSTANTNLVVAAFSNTSLGSNYFLGPGTTEGLYYSTDAGATWHQGGNGTDGFWWDATDVVYNATAGKFFAAVKGQGFYSSSDGGANWSRLTNQPVSFAASCNSAASCDMLRGQLAVRPGSADMYAWVIGLDGTTNKGISKTTDGGATAWSSLSLTGITTCGDSNGCGTSQGFYDLYLAAVPNGTGTDLYAGAVNVYKCNIPSGQAGTLCSAASGTSNIWLNLTHVYGSCSGSYHSMHPDNHGIDFLTSNPNIMYFSNDGGAYRTLNSAGMTVAACSSASSNPFDDLNTASLGSLSQFISISQHPTDATVILGGTQDNGSPGMATSDGSTSGTSWFEANNGDGGYNEIDPVSPNIWYTANTGVSIQKCVGTGAGGFNSGDSCIRTDGFSSIITSTQVGGDGGSFYTPYILDPYTTTDLIVGTSRIWRGPNTGANLTNISPSMGSVTAIAAGGPQASGVATVMYVGADTGPPGRIWVTTNADNASPTWTNVNTLPANINLNGNGYLVSGFAIDSADSTGHTAYVTMQGFGASNGSGRVFKTTDAGATWTDVGVGLPNAPADGIAIDPRNSSVLYVATDVGVFITTNGGGAWTEYGTGLPNVAAMGIRIFNHGGTQKLRIGTHGRGVWQTDLVTINNTPSAVSVTPSSGSFTTQTFSMLYSDADGFADIGSAYVEFNASNTLAGACAAQYNSATNGLYINKDDGTGWTGPITVGAAGLLSNSQCSISTASASVNGSVNNLTVTLPITFAGTFTGAKNTYLDVVDNSAATSGWQLKGTWSPVAAAAPTPVSVSPSSGGGASQLFTFLYSSVNGYLSIGSVETLINTSQTNANGCVVFYNRVNNTVQLENDAGTTFSGALTLGQVGTLSNSQCSLNVGTSSVVGSGTNLTLKLALTFTTAFSGQKQVFMWAKNTGSLSSGFVNKGTWTVPGTAIQAVAVTPNTGSGASQTFSFLYSHPSGFASITATEILINQYQVNSNGCVVFFTRSSNALQLQNDAGNGWLGPITMGQAGTLSNSQCTLNSGSSSVSGSGTNLTVNLALTFTSAFPGKRNIYMWGKDAAVNTGWQQRGSWTPFPSVAPTAVSVTPSSGAGASQTFSMLYSDTSGWTAIGSAEVMINGTLSNVNGCIAFYNRSAQTVQLQNDAGNGWLGPLHIAQAGTLQNTQCSIDVGASSFVGSANNLTVNLAVTFKAGFTGSKKVYMWVKDNGSLNSGWQQRGTWTTP